MSLYEWQRECLELIKDKNSIISAPTNAGKTKVAYTWMEPAKAREGEHRIIYTVPIKALANEKVDELISLYGKDMVGIETGDIKRREKAGILVCTQEIYTLKYAQKKGKHKVIVDEFHYIFSDNQRSRAYIEGIKRANKSHQFLVMSATLSNAEKVKDYLQRTTGKEFVLYQTDFRPTKLTFTKDIFSLDNIPPYSLVYVFNTRAIDRLAKALSAMYPPLPLLKRRKIKALAMHYKVNPEKFPEIFHGIAKYHSKLTYTEKRFIERLVREGFIHVVLATNALGVGVNLPFQWVLFGHTFVPNGEGSKKLSKIDFVQLSGRAGRKGFFEEGFVGFLMQEYTYESAKENYSTYSELLNKPMEEPVIKLEIDVWAVIKGERTLEEEVEYVVNFSEPKRDKKEVEELSQEIQRLLSGASKLELEFMKNFYQPELSLEGNLYLAKKVIKAKVQEMLNEKEELVRFKQIFLKSLFKNSGDDISHLLMLRRIGRRLKDKRFMGAMLVFPDLKDVEREIKELDPLLLEVGL